MDGDRDAVGHTLKSGAGGSRPPHPYWVIYVLVGFGEGKDRPVCAARNANRSADNATERLTARLE
jgi:hypothetical protein